MYFSVHLSKTHHLLPFLLKLKQSILAAYRPLGDPYVRSEGWL